MKIEWLNQAIIFMKEIIISKDRLLKIAPYVYPFAEKFLVHPETKLL